MPDAARLHSMASRPPHIVPASPWASPFAQPDGAVGDAPLILARVLADEEWQVPRAYKVEIRFEELRKRNECLVPPPVVLIAAQPFRRRREIAAPAIRRGQDQLPTRPDELGEFQHELDRVFQ